MILPKNDRLTDLWIDRLHRDLHHARVRDILVASRQKVWILSGRQAIKRRLKECTRCRTFSATPFNQVMAPLPADRVTEGRPFRMTGVDFMGPFYIKKQTSSGQWMKKDNKAYVALFTCSTSRAIHLEVTEDLTTGSFLNALKRFIGRRGTPAIIHTDNAKTFKGAENYLKGIFDELQSRDIQHYYAVKGIKWRYITERAPWWGGYWEAMVRLVKEHAKRTLFKSLLTLDELHTIMIEIEAILNSRPLTYVYDDQREPSPISPSLLLTGSSLLSLPDPLRAEEEESVATLEAATRRHEYRNHLVHQFWQRWRTEYLQELQKTDKRFTEAGKPQLNDI